MAVLEEVLVSTLHYEDALFGVVDLDFTDDVIDDDYIGMAELG